MAGDMVFEKIPTLSRRVGDTTVASQSNSTLLLGRDRIRGVESGYGNGPQSGAAHLIAGRAGIDPSVRDDASSLYLSAKSDPDEIAETADFGEVQRGKSAAVMRADCIRIVPRQDLKVSVGTAYLLMSSDGSITLEGDVSLGQGAAQRILRGDAFAQFWSTLSIPTPMGPSGPPPPIPDSLLSSRNRVL